MSEVNWNDPKSAVLVRYPEAKWQNSVGEWWAVIDGIIRLSDHFLSSEEEAAWFSASRHFSMNAHNPAYQPVAEPVTVGQECE